MSVGPGAFASPGPSARPAREAAAGSLPQPGPAWRGCSHSKDPKPWDDFVPGWQLGLESLRGGGLRQLSGGPCPPLSAHSCGCFSPPPVFPPQPFSTPSPIFPRTLSSAPESGSALQFPAPLAGLKRRLHSRLEHPLARELLGNDV